MKHSISILTLSLMIIFTNSGIGQNKPDGLVIKTTIPENPIVSIKNDIYNPDAESIEKEYVASQNTMQNKNPLNKVTFDINAFQTIVHNGSEQYLSHCAVTERTGSTAGTIWVVAGIRSSTATNDWLGIFKFGQSGWTLQAAVFTQRFLGSRIDAELIEKDTGEKVLWIVTESAQSLSSKLEVYYAGLNLANFLQRTTGILNWPGAGPQDVYYCPRFTTDNYDYPDNPWIYLVTSLDSLTFDNKHVYAQKFAYITLPHDLNNAQIHYRPSILPVFWPNGGTTEAHTLYSDIAYYRPSTTQIRLIITYSNVPDDTKIWLSICSSLGSNAQLLGTIEGNGNYRISNSAIASSGGGLSQQLMVVFRENYQNSGDWDLVSARSNDAGSTWYLNYIDAYSSTTDRIPNLGVIVSRKGVEDEYYVSYSLGSVDSIMSTKSNNGVTNYWDQRVRMDGIYPTNFGSSSVGITNTPDERVTVWSSLISSTNFNLIGSFWPQLPSSIEDESEINPNSFHLYQNFPNPFNPSTKIKFVVPSVIASGAKQSQFVTLKVYDVLGNEVAILVNEEKPAGNYEINFDAGSLSSGVYYYRLVSGSFIETKKMILLK